MYKRNFLDYIFLFLKGLAMGAANKVPGVSGGMVALVTGFYEELIYSFQKFNKKALQLLLKGRFRSFFQYVNFKFLLIVNLGSLSAYFSVSLVLDYFIKNYEIYVWSLFFGLIMGSIYYIKKSLTNINLNTYILIAIGTSLGLLLTFIDPLPPNSALWFVFLCGIISVSGMTLPGLSGSFILIILGNYVLLLVDSVNNLFFIISHSLIGDFSFMQNPERVELLRVVVVFFFGSVAGLLIFSKLIGYLLKRRYNQVIALLLGFILGSLGVAWPWKNKIFKIDEAHQYILDSNGEKILLTYKRFLPNIFESSFYIAILFIIIGFLIVWIIEYYEKRQKKTLRT